EMYGFQERLIEFYLTYNCELFYCRVDELKRNGRNVHVRKVSEVTLDLEPYSANVLLIHKCDEVTRRRHVNIKVGGITLIQRSLFTAFGQCKNYKIILNLSFA